MKEFSWIALAFIMFVLLLASNQNNANGVKTDWYDDGTLVAQRDGGNFISGSGITVTGADNVGSNRVDLTIAATGLITSAFGEMRDVGNTDEFTVNSEDDHHSYHSNGLAGDDLLNWTFDAGGGGTSFAISGVTDPGGGQIEATTSSAHGLAVDDVISITNTTDYDDVYIIDSVPTTTTFQVTDTFVSSQTGTMDQAAVINADAGAAGTYQVTWSAGMTSAANNETFDFEVFIGETTQDDTHIRRKFGTAMDFGSTSGTAIIDILVGDKISFALTNTDSAGNILIRDITIILHQI